MTKQLVRLICTDDQQTSRKKRNTQELEVPPSIVKSLVKRLISNGWTVEERKFL